MSSKPEVGLALSGGNALGAYEAGAYEALHQHGVQPDVISGASVGAVTGALIAGNPPERRIPALRAFWRQATAGSWWGQPAASGWGREIYNSWHTWQTLVMGRPGLFHPTGLTGNSLFDTGPLLATLQQLVDFDHLHEKGPRLVVCAVDLETGEALYFDSRHERITPQLLMASTGLLPCYQPMEVDGRLLGDPGLVCNLPLDPLLAPSTCDRVCLAVDLFGGTGSRPRTLSDAVERAQDIVLSSQGRRTLQAFRREQHLRHRLQQAEQALGGAASQPERSTGRVDLVLVEHHSPAHAGGGKTLEYSTASVQERWAAGLADMTAALHQLEVGEPEVRDLGFALYRVPRRGQP